MTTSNRGRSLGTRRAVAIANGARKVRRLRRESKVFCGEITIALDLAEQSIEQGVCPSCGKSFNDCEYFKALDKE